jgi:hypothetical protein
VKKAFLFLTVLLAIEIVLAIICAPYSCDWGNEVYFYAGIIVLIISFVLPLLQKTTSTTKRIVYGFLFVLITAVVWIACFILFDFKIMCRLF